MLGNSEGMATIVLQSAQSSAVASVNRPLAPGTVVATG
jgi:hypothetical protein